MILYAFIKKLMPRHPPLSRLLSPRDHGLILPPHPQGRQSFFIL